VLPARDVVTTEKAAPAKEATPVKDSPAVAPVEPSFATWVDPPVIPPTEEWERRLNAYAKKCAGQLLEKGVPLFRSEWPRGNSYRDAFWLIACDVDWGNRSWVANHFHTDPPAAAGQRPSPQKGDFVGSFNGSALLLTRSGILCVADIFAFLTRSGGVDDREMDMTFTEIERPITLFRGHEWGWYNRGTWRRYPKDDLKVYGVDAHVQSIRYEKRYSRKTPHSDDGRDTSAALTNFVKTNGQTRWPRGFISFDY
jgi:hypothetical protein